jgi:hypothetical protein
MAKKPEMNAFEAQSEDLTVDQIITLYKEIGENERHFNDLESKYRLQAGAWVVATFAAIGYINSRTLTDASWLNLDLVSVVACILGFGALHITWQVDIGFYHQLLDCQFIEGLELERKYKFLPQSRQKIMWHADDNRFDKRLYPTKIKSGDKLGKFYSTLFLAIAFLATVFSYRALGFFFTNPFISICISKLIRIVISLFGLCLLGFWARNTYLKTGRSEAITRWHEWSKSKYNPEI